MLTRSSESARRSVSGSLLRWDGSGTRRSQAKDAGGSKRVSKGAARRPPPCGPRPSTKLVLMAVYELDPKGMVLLEEALTTYKELRDRSGMALAICNLGHAVLHLGNRERA